MSTSLSIPTYLRASAWLYLLEEANIEYLVWVEIEIIVNQNKEIWILWVILYWTVFLTLPVVKEELLPLQNGSFGKDPNAVVSIHHYHCHDMH